MPNSAGFRRTFAVRAIDPFAPTYGCPTALNPTRPTPKTGVPTCHTRSRARRDPTHSRPPPSPSRTSPLLARPRHRLHGRHIGGGDTRGPFQRIGQLQRRNVLRLLRLLQSSGGLRRHRRLHPGFVAPSERSASIARHTLLPHGLVPPQCGPLRFLNAAVRRTGPRWLSWMAGRARPEACTRAVAVMSSNPGAAGVPAVAPGGRAAARSFGGCCQAEEKVSAAAADQRGARLS